MPHAVLSHPLLVAHPVRGPINLTQWVDFSWAEELTFIIDVQTQVGTPTAGNLTATFQKRIPNKVGFEQWSTQRLSDLTPEEAATWVTEGNWPSPLAAYNFASPITIQRTIRNFGNGVNLKLDASDIAGTGSPAFQVSVVLIAKG